MDKDIKMIEIDEKIEEKYYQAIARLVDNPRFIIEINVLRPKMILEFILRKKTKASDYGIKDIQPSEIDNLLVNFRYPKEFGYLIWMGIINKKISSKDITALSSIDWVAGKKISKSLKDTALEYYLSMVLFEKKIYRNFRFERNCYWKNKIEKLGYLKIAKLYDSNKSSVEMAIKRYKEKINF